MVMRHRISVSAKAESLEALNPDSHAAVPAWPEPRARERPDRDGARPGSMMHSANYRGMGRGMTK